MRRFWISLLIFLSIPVSAFGADRSQDQRVADYTKLIELLSDPVNADFAVHFGAILSGIPAEVVPVLGTLCDSDRSSDEIYREDDDYIRMILPGPDGTTIRLRIRKRDGKVMIDVCGLKIRGITLPCLTYWLRPREGDLVDDLFPPFETKFCEFKREGDIVVFRCDFDYLGFFKWKGEWRVYVINNQLCLQKNSEIVTCFPIEGMPPGLRRMWEDADPHYLPPAPPREIVPMCPRELAPIDYENPVMNPNYYGMGNIAVR